MEGMDFSAMRETMVQKGVEENTLARVIRTVDDMEQQGLLKQTNNYAAYSIIGVGAVLFFVGAIVTIASYINYGGAGLLWYGAIILGISMFIGGLKALQR